MPVHYVKSSQVVERKVRDEQILVPIGGHADELEALYNLNEVAGLIWDASGEGLSTEQIADRIVETYDVDRAKALTDAETTIRHLVEIGALEPVEEGSG